MRRRTRCSSARSDRRRGARSSSAGRRWATFPAVLHGGRPSRGRVRRSGALLPGLPFVVIGRGPDYAWTATSSQADNVDIFAESLCGDDRHYLYNGSCREMTSLDAGTLRSTGSPDQRLNLLQTVLAPCWGTRRSAGRASRYP